MDREGPDDGRGVADMKRVGKYGNRRTKRALADGTVVTFDSAREARRWDELVLLERAGKIAHLRRQVPYELVPARKGERVVNYYADFVYFEGGRRVVEDCKGHRTDVYKLKRRLMQHVHDIEIRET